MHIYLDFNVNFMKMSVADTLDFISFFAFRCNGTTVLAEIHRVIMRDREMYRVRATAFGDSFYEFLYDLADELFPEVDAEIIVSVLENNDCNMEKTVDQLISLFR